MAMETTIERVEGPIPVTVVSLDGELDASNFEALIDAVRGLYDGGARQLLLDLSACGSWRAPGSSRCTRSSGSCTANRRWTRRPAGPRCHTPVDETQTEVQLCGPLPAVERVLARTGLDRLFVDPPGSGVGARRDLTARDVA